MKYLRRATSEARAICLFRDCTSVANGSSRSASPARPAASAASAASGWRSSARMASNCFRAAASPVAASPAQRRGMPTRSGRAARIADRSFEVRASPSAARTNVASAVCATSARCSVASA